VPPRKARRVASDRPARDSHAASTAGQLRSREATSTKPALQFVYNGRECIGRIACLGRRGFEAFDADGRSLGVFPSLKRAADAVSDGGGQ
jgi:hypothetical protein